MRRSVATVLASIALGACASILGLREEDEQPFEHRAHALQGISCVRCHAGITEAEDTGPLHLPGQETCLECHQDPHDTRLCRGCHGVSFVEERLASAKHHLRFAHQNHVPILAGNCVRCHERISRTSSTLLPEMAACLGCHEHQGEFATRRCANCHVDIESEGVRPESHVVHGADFLQRHGVAASSSADLCSTCHRETFCAECHGITVPVLASRREFDAPNTIGIHRAGFFARHHLEASAQPGLCATCHVERFCQECHAEMNVSAIEGSAVNPHPPGWVGVGSGNAHGRAARRDPFSCASCHGGAGEALCVRCHQVGGIGGSIHPPNFTSNRSFSDLPCRLCHSSP